MQGTLRKLLCCLLVVQVLVLGAASVNSGLHEALHSHAEDARAHADHAGEPCSEHPDAPAASDADHLCAVVFFAAGAILLLLLLSLARYAAIARECLLLPIGWRAPYHLLCATFGARAPPYALSFA